MAGHHRGGGAREVEDAAGDFLGLAEPAERRARPDLVFEPGPALTQVGAEIGVEEGRRDGVHPDAPARPFDGERAGA